VFDRAADALAGAAAMQQALVDPPIAETDKDGKAWKLQMRIGVHRAVEEIVPRTDGATGKPSYASLSDVNLAARVMSLAAGGQIVVSDTAYQAAGTRGRYQWQAWPNRRLKSFDQPETVHELLWDNGTTRGEPGLRWLPLWFLGEPNRYIERPAVETKVLGL